MIKALRYFFAHHKVALAGFIAACGLALFFGVRIAMDFIYFHDPRHQNEALKAWMTPRYVSMSFRVPPKHIKGILRLETMEGKRNTMGAIAKRKDITLAELDTIVREGAEAFHNNKRLEHKADKPKAGEAQ